ncbi:MAG: GNAT family N-acetyltransferase [Acidobacteriota bacterium]|nr:GNAT family N-acetyltransferase [Acidobacteriota bacterium]
MASKKATTRIATVIGERVFLRRPSTRDMGEFLALTRSSRTFHRGLTTPPLTPDQFTSSLKRWRKSDSACFLVCLIEDGTILGLINLSQIFMGGFRSAYMGYYIGAPFAGRGYMTEAIRLMLRYAFRDLKLHRVEANIQPQNAASIALVRRAGFRREGYSPRYLKIEGRWRDHERWTMLVEDWRAKGT